MIPIQQVYEKPMVLNLIFMLPFSNNFEILWFLRLSELTMFSFGFILDRIVHIFVLSASNDIILIKRRGETSISFQGHT